MPGLRRSELLALRWEDFNADDATLAVTGKLLRAKGVGIQWLPEPKTDAGYRTVPLPKFAVSVLQARRGREFVGQQRFIFPSTVGTLRDPNNLGKQWRKVRDDLGVPEVTSHSFRKTIATPHRRRGPVGPDRCRSAGPLQRLDDSADRIGNSL